MDSAIILCFTFSIYTIILIDSVINSWSISHIVMIDVLTECHQFFPNLVVFLFVYDEVAYSTEPSG